RRTGRQSRRECTSLPILRKGRWRLYGQSQADAANVDRVGGSRYFPARSTSPHASQTGSGVGFEWKEVRNLSRDVQKTTPDPVTEAKPNRSDVPMRWRRRHKIGVLLATVTVAALCGSWLWDHRGYWLVDNLRAVEPGRIYAGGYQYPMPLRRIV